MLNFRRQRPHLAEAPASLLERPDLQIRNLLDDPGLRRAMGLEPTGATVGDVTVLEVRAGAVARPERRFDRRRLLEDAAA